MYPKNIEEPRSIAAKVISNINGSPITTGVVAYYISGTTRAVAAGVTTHVANGLWQYQPVRAEINYDTFAIEFYHVDAVCRGPVVIVSTSTGLETVVDGRQGISVVQYLTGSDYPLVASPTPPSLDIRYLLADLWVAFDDPADYPQYATDTPFEPPFRIGYLYGFGFAGGGSRPEGVAVAINQREIVILDANDRIVVDTAAYDGQDTIFYRRAWNDRLEIIGWEKRNSTTFVIVHTKWPDPPHPAITPRIYRRHLVPDNAVLDNRTWQRRPRHVRTLRAVLSSITGEAVEFAPGYNMEMTLGSEITSGNRTKSRITFDADPAKGLGTFPACEPEPLFIKTLNGVPPDDQNHNVNVVATDCYWVRRPYDVETLEHGEYHIPWEGALLVGNDCKPCCECDYFVETAEYLNRIHAAYDAIGKTASRTQRLYHANRQRWLAAKCCFERRSLRLQLRPQICPHLDVLGQFCNWTPECVESVKLIFDFSETPTTAIDTTTQQPAGVIVPGFTNCYGNVRRTGRRSSVTMRCNVNGSWPVFDYTFDAVEPYQNVWVKFRLWFEGCGTDDNTDPFVIRACLQATIADEPLLTPCDEIHPSESSESSAWFGSRVCEEAELRCPPPTTDIYNPARCFSRRQIFQQIES